MYFNSFVIFIWAIFAQSQSFKILRWCPPGGGIQLKRNYKQNSPMIIFESEEVMSFQNKTKNNNKENG